MNRYVLGPDGLTVIQRLRGGNPRQPVAHFGETVLFPMLKREQAKWGDEVEHAGRWAKGVWLGRSWNSNESIIAHANGISRPRTTKRFVTEKKWRIYLVEKVTVLPLGEDVAIEDDEEEAQGEGVRAE